MRAWIEPGDSNDCFVEIDVYDGDGNMIEGHGIAMRPLPWRIELDDRDIIGSELNFNKIHDLVYVYNVIDNPEQIVNQINYGKNNPSDSVHFNDWQPWNNIGEYIVDLHHLSYDPDNERSKQEYTTIEYITSLFYSTTNHYLKDKGLQVDPAWDRMGPSFCKYDKDSESVFWCHLQDASEEIKKEDLSMIYHTDYVYADRYDDGNKFILTCTMYLNDDYDGGDLKFNIGDEWFSYKPKAGDIVIFPSGHPELLAEAGTVFHGVGRVDKTDKYLVRCFYQKWTEGLSKDD